MPTAARLRRKRIKKIPTNKTPEPDKPDPKKQKRTQRRRDAKLPPSLSFAMLDPKLITIAIVEDDDEFRQGLASLIDESEGFCCVGAYRDCETALSGVAKEKPDVVLMDIQLPGMSGIAGVERLKQILPATDVIMLTIHKDDELVFSSLCAGATGYLVKTTKPAKILEAIRDVYEGGAPMSSNIARMIVGSFRRATQSPLSPREKEVLAELCKGHSYKMIAGTLFVSERTVNFHIKNIYQKLQVHSKSEAVVKALREKLV
jgi:DNA-binding NarL/FixJ family response regulator